MTIFCIALAVVSLVIAGVFAYGFFARGMLASDNKHLIEENEEIQKKSNEYLEKGKALYEQNRRLDQWKKYLNADAKANEIMVAADRTLRDADAKANEIMLAADRTLRDAGDKSKRIIDKAKTESTRMVEEAKAMVSDLEKSIPKKHEDSIARLRELETLISEAHKTYKYRKTLPDTHEKLKTRFDDLKSKYDQLQSDFKEAKSKNKGVALDSKERDKFLSRFDKLGRDYVEDTFRFIASKMTPSNFTASRDRIVKAIEKCRSLGFEWESDYDEKYVEKVREEFKRVLRIEENRLEQQRIKEQIREEQKALRELDKLKKKEEEAIKERENAERQREEMQRAIADALTKANGEHTSQILEMEKALAEKDSEIAAKQQEIDDNQRAISNAQITKAGHVYVLSNIGSFGDGVFKIGMTRRNDPQDRVTELGDASVPFPFDVHMMVGCDNAPELEKKLHRIFNNNRVNRVNLRKEFFRVNVDEVRKEVIGFLGKDVDYIADPHIFDEYAEQYRESQQTTLADIEEVEKIYEEAGIDEDD